MKMTSKIALLAMATTAAVTASTKEGFHELNLNLPTGEKNLAGIEYNLTDNVVYETEHTICKEKFIGGWIGGLSVSVARTEKSFIEFPDVEWTVWTIEALKGEDDAWISIEFGM